MNLEIKNQRGSSAVWLDELPVKNIISIEISIEGGCISTATIKRIPIASEIEELRKKGWSIDEPKNDVTTAEKTFSLSHVVFEGGLLED